MCYGYVVVLQRRLPWGPSLPDAPGGANECIVGPPEMEPTLGPPLWATTCGTAGLVPGSASLAVGSVGAAAAPHGPHGQWWPMRLEIWASGQLTVQEQIVRELDRLIATTPLQSGGLHPGRVHGPGPARYGDVSGQPAPVDTAPGICFWGYGGHAAGSRFATAAGRCAEGHPRWRDGSLVHCH